MSEFNQTAKAVAGFLRRNNIQQIDVTAVSIVSDISLRVEWSKGGRAQGEILMGLDAATVHMARAILTGQTAEPLHKFGEGEMHHATRGPNYVSNLAAGFTAEL